jgi:hypothetical protein
MAAVLTVTVLHNVSSKEKGPEGPFLFDLFDVVNDVWIVLAVGAADCVFVGFVFVREGSGAEYGLGLAVFLDYGEHLSAPSFATIDI